ncbi:MAG: hypothetical protein WAX60_19610, partial [Blautia wexlerae]
MSIGLYIVLAPLYLKSVRKLQEKRFVFVKILAIIIPENGAKVSKIKCFQFAQQTLNYRFDSESPMALVLVGQSELWEDKLRLKRYDAVRQRIDINCVLPHLDRAETEKYIQSHLAYA